MSTENSDKHTPALLAFPSAKGSSATRPANMAFDFMAADNNVPELDLLSVDPAHTGDGTEPEASNTLDLSAKKKIIFWVGRGKTGKTTGIRWLAETVLAQGTPLLMADMDTTNDTFSRYAERVARPPEASDPTSSLKWLDRLLQHALQEQTSLLVDLGGGDTNLRRLVAQLPDLAKLFETQGFAIVLCHTTGPQEEDLSPLATLQGLGFRPTATAIILNEALVEPGDTREAAFARIFRHSVFRQAVSIGAVPIYMPRLFAAQQVEVRRLKFREAVDGRTGRGDAPLGPFDRARVAKWLDGMSANFEPIRSWLP
ncbi:hypothetical protein [Acidocella sp.]|uniref:hypothetical protein n=1 Tax=Acidocella sp. TaxID=50710 RepID=UPI003D0414E3